MGSIPVLLVTARVGEEEVVQGLDVGADDYVTKPVNPRILGARLRSALRAKKSQEAVVQVNRQLQEELARRQRLEMELVQSQKLEAIGRLAAGIAHEINTPAQFVGDNITFLTDSFHDLDALLAHVERLAATATANVVPAETVAQLEAQAQHLDIAFLRQEVPGALRNSLEGVMRIANIVRAMKEFSHPGTQEKTFTDINRAIENTLAVAQNQWKYVADVVTDYDTTLPLVPCFAAAFNQVILNLLLNAAETIAEKLGEGANAKGTITVCTRRNGDAAEIQIADTGRGIPPDIRTKVFDPFFTTKEVGKGTGQGLAIVHAIVVEKHGGTISVETEVEQGTTFTIRLPVALVQVPPAMQPS